MNHIICHQGNANQQDTTAHPLEWTKSSTLTLPNAGEDTEQQESQSLLVGTQNGAATVGDCLSFSQN